MTVKFFEHRDPTLHIIISGSQTQNKSTNDKAVGTQIDAQHIAEGTLTSMSVADFLALVNESEQFTKRMPDLSEGIYTSFLQRHAADAQGRSSVPAGKNGTYRMLYTEEALRREKEASNRIYADFVKKAALKGQNSAGKPDTKKTIPTGNIYTDYILKHNLSRDYEDGTAANSAEKTIEALEKAGEVATIQNIGSTYPEYSRLLNATTSDNAAKTNPRYKSQKYEYTHNCQRCVPAWELRERGLDVQAMPCKPKSEIDQLMSSPYSLWQFNPLDKDKTKRVQVDKVGTGKESIIKFLQECGYGSRCEIVVEWRKLGEGHAFCAKNIGGQIVFFDPQTGRSGAPVEGYFDHVVPGKTTWLRIDGLDIKESVRKDVIRNPYEKN